MTKAEKALTAAVENEERAQIALTSAAETAQAVNSTTRFGRVMANMRIGIAKLKVSLLSMWSAFAPMAIITVLSAIVGYFVNMYKEAKRVKGLFQDYKNELSNSGNTTEISRLEKLKKLADDTSGLKEKHKIWTQIGVLMGEVQKKNEGDLNYQERINKKFQERIKLLKSTAEIDYLYRKKLETEDQIKTLGSKLKSKASNTVSSISTKVSALDGPLGIKTLWNMFNPWNGLKKVSDETNLELQVLNNILSDVSSG